MNRGLLLLVMLALLIRIALPSGMMPVVSSSGTFTVALCTGTGPLSSEPTHKVSFPAKPGEAPPCPFALATHETPPAPDFAILVASPAPVARATDTPVRLPGLVARPLAAPPPPAQAPPAFA